MKLMHRKKKGAARKKGFHIPRIFDNNTSLLIFSLLCSVIIWFLLMDQNMADNRENVISNIPINVQLSDAAQESGVRIFSQSTMTADVTVSGSSMVAGGLTSEDISVFATLDVSPNMLTGSGLQQTTLSLRAAKKGNTLADYDINAVSPGEITVVYDKYKESQLTIQRDIKYTAAENYYAASSPALSTDLLSIAGPESSVNKVARAALLYQFDEPLSESKSITCKVTLFDINGDVIDPAALYLQLSDTTVDVSIAVTGRQTVQLVPDLRNMPTGFSENRITVNPGTIEIGGDRETVSKYTTLTLGTPINFQDITPTNNVFQVTIPVPSGVNNLSKLETTTVTFNLNGYSESKVNVSDISVVNKPEDKHIEVATKVLSVKVVGTAAQISRLSSESVFGTIDMSNVTITNGTLEVPVSISINGADSCWTVGTYTALIKVSDQNSSSANRAG